MGRSYWFECPRCGYRAKLSGGADRGKALLVQTILCHDCRELYDAVTRLKVRDDQLRLGGLAGTGWAKLTPQRSYGPPPALQAVLNRLPQASEKRFKWLSFNLQCPVSAMHRVRSWHDPDKCPRCGVFLEKSALPYRLWD